ncbi:MAG TPA: L-histidine N(alpha)-methyltransferase [Thermoanaerobaculia bacterium]|nr:L-histidine N(alpha)-methyltransferase [Thermoanaerobaculia bacterium]
MRETATIPASRADLQFELHRLPGAASTFAADVARGLSAMPKSVPPKHLYDELGSRLFEAICALPEYYLTRVEGAILAELAGELVGAFGGPIRLVELGSGSSEKTRVLIEAAIARQGELLYVPIDVSTSALLGSGRTLSLDYPELSIVAVAGEFAPALGWLAAAEARGEVPAPGATLVLFLGSTFGNLLEEEREPFLLEIRSHLAPGDGFLLGVDLKKPPSVLLPAYDDPLGVTAAFDRNLLGRINRELQGTFDLRTFAHRARYDSERARIEMHLESDRAQEVAIHGLDLTVPFAAGETIHTENSYRFDLDQMGALARATGFALARSWSDAEERFASCLFRAL